MADDGLATFHPGDFLHEDDPWRDLNPSLTQYQTLLNDARLLFVLATEPSRLLPDGKTIASIFSEPPADAPQKQVNPLEDQIAEMVHQAFWEEVEMMSSCRPQVPL